MDKESNCPCGRNNPFMQCCGRFLVGSQKAKTPEQLMRSRYTAYALGGYGEYLLQTWFPATARGLDSAELSSRSQDWRKLEILGKSQQGDNAEVEFRAYFFDEKGAEQVMHENSSFKRIKGSWYYVGVSIK